MTNETLRSTQLTAIMNVVRARFWLLLGPTIAFTLVGLVAAVSRPTRWQAYQALVVRDTAIGNLGRQGRFDTADNMKAFQETILEVARNAIVVSAALKELGPEIITGRASPDPRNVDWPTKEAVQAMQKGITVTAPKGAEFGKTEVIYLSVTGRTPAAAQAATRAVCDQLEKHLAELRNAKAESLILELENNLTLAQNDLETSTVQLEQMEREVGADVAELRNLSEIGAGDSNLRLTLNQLKSEHRQALAMVDAQTNLYNLLSAAQKDPNQIVATPGRLLDSQPALKKLKDGLVDAQLRTAELLGHRSAEHPAVIAAKRAEERVRQDLHDELELAVRGAQGELSVSQALASSLAAQIESTEQRLSNLAGMRARYSNLVSSVQQRTTIVERATQELSQARANQTASKSVSLLTRFQDPITSSDPLGPSRFHILAGGMAGGLLTGAGLLVLTWPNSRNQTRRWSDYLSFGRRSTDAAKGRRAEDRLVVAQPVATPGRGRRAEDRTTVTSLPVTYDIQAPQGTPVNRG